MRDELQRLETLPPGTAYADTSIYQSGVTQRARLAPLLEKIKNEVSVLSL